VPVGRRKPLVPTPLLARADSLPVYSIRQDCKGVSADVGALKTSASSLFVRLVSQPVRCPASAATAPLARPNLHAVCYFRTNDSQSGSQNAAGFTWTTFLYRACRNAALARFWPTALLAVRYAPADL
jgi:hypothetical protein